MPESPFTIPQSHFADSVLAEYPELRDPLLGDAQRAVLLRQWAWSHIDYAPSTEAAELFQADEQWLESEAPDFFDRFKKGEGGGICGVAARGLQKLYAYFGYRAWAYGCECAPGGPSHAVALVEVVLDGEQRIVIQDAGFNVTLHDRKTNLPLSFLEVIERLRDSRDRSIRVVESDFYCIKTWPRYIVAPEFTAIHTPAHCLGRSGYVIEDVATYTTRDDGTVLITSPRSWSYFIEKKCYNRVTGQPAVTLAEIVACGCPASMLYLYRYPDWLNGPDSDELLALAKSLAENPDAKSSTSQGER